LEASLLLLFVSILEIPIQDLSILLAEVGLPNHRQEHPLGHKEKCMMTFSENNITKRPSPLKGNPAPSFQGPIEWGTTHVYAQNNLQLFSQLFQLGYSHTEIIHIVEAYHLATQLFTCLYRPSYKCFVSHLVGTASILSTLRAPVALIAAGLLHAAYFRGVFGEDHKGISESKRNQMRSVVGPETEAYIARYMTLPWTGSMISSLQRDTAQLSDFDRNVVILRLANELEDHLDLAILYGPNIEKRIARINRIGHLLIDLSQKLGVPVLGKEFERVFNESLAREIPLELRRTSSSYDSFSTIPFSYRRPRSLWFAKFFGHPGHQRNGQPSEAKTCTFSTWIPSDSLKSLQAEMFPNSGIDSQPSYAQTNIQLYNQLREMGYSKSALICVRKAYETAAQLFAGRYQLHEKPLIVHVVRTASILTSLQAPVEVVAAGLIHNAYQNGDFGTGENGFTSTKHRYLLQAVGPDVEQYVAGFTFLKWTPQSFSGILQNLTAHPSIDHYAVLLRLADLLEHNFDHGVLYLKQSQQERYFSPSLNPLMIKIAEKLGYPLLVQELQRIQEHNSTDSYNYTKIPKEMPTKSFVCYPKSCRKRLVIFLIQTLKPSFPRLAETLGSLILRVKIGTGRSAYSRGVL
jgi:hypothetical protein